MDIFMARKLSSNRDKIVFSSKMNSMDENILDQVI